MRTRIIALAALVATPFLAVAGQAAAPRNVISFQPLTAMFTVYAAEYERAVGNSFTLGAGITSWAAGANDELSYDSGDLKVRFYPSGAALLGFSIGGSVGLSNITGRDSDGTKASVGGPSGGVLIEYQWLLGAKRNFAVSLGAGAKVLLVDETEVGGSTVTARYPTSRISIGYAF